MSMHASLHIYLSYMCAKTQLLSGSMIIKIKLFFFKKVNRVTWQEVLICTYVL